MVTGYCHQCDAEREILLTVPWQDNSCRRCGSTDVTVERES
jgi:ribosomal protein L40E